jgi:serine/threonine protein kinase
MANGIHYLHTLPIPVLHRDIKSANFLLERNYKGYIVKICDFGLAETRIESTRQSVLSTPVAHTLPWTAPERLRGKQHTEKSDIYSLGVVYWELSIYERPYDDLTDGGIREMVIAGDRLEIPETTPSTFRDLITKCWAQDPGDRPTSSELIAAMKECIQSAGNLPFFIFDN